MLSIDFRLRIREGSLGTSSLDSFFLPLSLAIVRLLQYNCLGGVQGRARSDMPPFKVRAMLQGHT